MFKRYFLKGKSHLWDEESALVGWGSAENNPVLQSLRPEKRTLLCQIFPLVVEVAGFGLSCPGLLVGSVGG